MEQAFGVGASEKPATKQRQPKKSGGRPNYTHFLSIPIGQEDSVKNNYNKLIEQISSLTKVPIGKLTSSSMLHLTLLMLDFTEDDEKL